MFSMKSIKNVISGAVSSLLFASNAFAANAQNTGQEMVKNGITYNLGSMFGNLVSGVDAQFQDPLNWVYNNLAHLFLLVPIIVVMIIVITKAGVFGGHGRDASQIAQGEQQITHVLKLVGTGVIICGLIYIVGTKFIL
jgi:hypothetical protein